MPKTNTTTPPPSDDETMKKEMEAALAEGEPQKKKKRPRTENTKKPKEVHSSKGNRWIDFYMTWRKENPEIVEATNDVKTLVRLARKEYTPLSKNVFCTKCGHENTRPFKRLP